MGNIAQFTPVDYIKRLHSLSVPGYDGTVAITRYMSANPAYGGNARPADLLNAIAAAVKKRSDLAAKTKVDGYARVFTGQGDPDGFINVMSLVVELREELMKTKALAEPLKKGNYLQELCDRGVFGMDCIGFVGTYMSESCLEPSYPGGRPLDYTAKFPPIKDVDEIEQYSVVMKADGQHIQMINDYELLANGTLKVDLCQSASWAGPFDSKKGYGPQFNGGVLLRPGGGSYLPVEAFRAAMAKFKQQNSDPKAIVAKEKELRKEMTETNRKFGFCGGAIFQLGGDGSPPNPVSGSVYIGVMKGGGIRIKTPRDWSAVEYQQR